MSDWDVLYESDRFDLQVPAEDVVRYLSALPIEGEALDIGCGAGRHLDLLRSMGWKAVGVDSSRKAVGRCEGAEVGEMTALPFKDERFQVALAHGVFCYGTTAEHERAVSELYRVLKPRGSALIRTRSTSDWRTGGVGSLEPEHGMVMNFLNESMLVGIYGQFRKLQYEWIEWTEDGRLRKNSDWLIAVQK